MRELFRKVAVLVIVMFVTSLSAGLTQKEACAAEKSKPLSKEELDALVAPVALYPDSLLAQVMMASTYPLDIVQAARFVKENSKLKPDQMAEKTKEKDWEPSVKSLLQFPDVLKMMNDKLDWTMKLGEAFLEQQKAVMDSVQRLRKQAQAAGNLKNTKEQVVIVEKDTIIIQPSNPQVIYVPTYNPTVVYGVWAYPAYPPAPVYPPGYVATTAAFSFAAGVAVGSSGCCWGGYNWHGGTVNINVEQYNKYTKNNYTGVKAEQYKAQANVQNQTWQHNAQQRKGVAYGSESMSRKYNQAPAKSSAASAQDVRGYAGKGAQGPSQETLQRGKGAKESAFSGAGSGGSERAASARGQMSRAGSSGGRKLRGEGGFRR
ncbi:MAG: DUF3300 domain-containing protein [Nitrospirota bacterium]